MRISSVEQQAIKQVVTAGETFGYGNMISHLKSAWAKMLRDKYGVVEPEAHSDTAGYPIKMHEDLMNNGCWDETGESYKQKKHELFKTGDVDAPKQIKDADGIVVLNCCRLCGKSEIELDNQEHCEGRS